MTHSSVTQRPPSPIPYSKAKYTACASSNTSDSVGNWRRSSLSYNTSSPVRQLNTR